MTITTRILHLGKGAAAPVLATMLATGLATGLGGCVSFGSEPPPSLLTLTPEIRSTGQATGQAAGPDAAHLIVMEPESPASIAVTRVPVQIDDSSIAYVKEAFWVERPARLFRSLVAETIRQGGQHFVIDGGDLGLSTSQRLRGTLRRFGYDARTKSAVVVFDAVLTGADGAMQSKRFEAEVPGVAAEAGPLGDALNRAANDVARQVAGWVG